MHRPTSCRNQHMRRSRFLRKRRSFRRLPLWAVFLLMAAALIVTVLDRESASNAVSSVRTRTLSIPTGRFEAHVVRVADGDTLTARTANGHPIKVRLARIDAPEARHGPKRPGQSFGDASTHSLRQLVSNGRIQLDCPETDHYQRHVCWVFADDVNVNLEQVRRGMAWVYRPSRRTSRREARMLAPLQEAQDAAKRARLGLWRDAEPAAPWDWRRECWQAGKCR